jgi:hypothetical protein
VYLPLRLDGIPHGAAVVSERIAATIEAGGRRWDPGWTTAGVSRTGALEDIHFMRADGPCWQFLHMDRAFYQAVKDLPAQVHVTIALTLLEDRQDRRMNDSGRTEHLQQEGICLVRWSPLPGNRSEYIARCRACANYSRSVVVSCAWPRAVPTRAYVRARSREMGEFSESLLTVDPEGMFAIGSSVWGRASTSFTAGPERLELNLETWRAAAFLERHVEISRVLLREYVAPRITDPR